MFFGWQANQWETNTHSFGSLIWLVDTSTKHFVLLLSASFSIQITVRRVNRSLPTALLFNSIEKHLQRANSIETHNSSIVRHSISNPFDDDDSCFIIEKNDSLYLSLTNFGKVDLYRWVLCVVVVAGVSAATDWSISNPKKIKIPLLLQQNQATHFDLPALHCQKKHKVY